MIYSLVNICNSVYLCYGQSPATIGFILIMGVTHMVQASDIMWFTPGQQ